MKLLMVIDMQKDFVDEDGVLYSPDAAAVIEPVARIIRDYTADNLPIVATRDWHDPDDKEFERFPAHCVADTPGAQFTQSVQEALEGYENLHIISKTRYSAFFGTNLEGLLQQLNPELVEVVGVATNICVLHTVEELRNRDIPVRVHSEAVASFDPEGHQFALKHMEAVLGAEIV